MADIRASSLQEAIRFASRWNLLGIVSAAEPLILCPKLIRYVFMPCIIGCIELTCIVQNHQGVRTRMCHIWDIEQYSR